MEKYSLLAPGPVNLHPEVQAALGLPMIHHRTPAFDTVLAQVLEKIKQVFQTSEHVYLLSSTGSGAMEACLVNVLSRGDLVLAIDSGKFGERWAEMASTFGAEVKVLKVPWGEAVDPKEVRNFLEKNPRTRAVLCQACETSTGVKHPIQELGSVVAKHPETLLLVDGITAVGAFPLPMDQWQIDGLVAGSQKAFMLPTGMGFLAFSKKAQSFFDKADTPRFYFDVRKELKANLKGETFFSSNVTLTRALSIALDLMLKPGFLEKIARRSRITQAAVKNLGLSLFAQVPAESVTSVVVPAEVDSTRLRLEIEEKYNITLMGGQDQAKGKILRIGHMGHIKDSEIRRVIQAIGESIKAQNLKGTLADLDKALSDS